MLLNAIGKSIKRRRKEINVTQPELARIAHVSVNTISQIERGKMNPSVITLNKILDSLGMVIDIKIKGI